MHLASSSRIVIFLMIALVSGSCTNAPEQGSYITYLGQDTLAAEQFTVTGNRVEAKVMLRTPSTTLRHYTMELDEAGIMRRLEATVRDPASPEAPPLSKDLLLATSSGFERTSSADGEETRRSIETTPDALPFLDMIHWPFELMLKRAYAADSTTITQNLIAGRRAMPFELVRLSADSMTVRHPSRGIMGVSVDNAGRLQTLDAGATTRKVRVYRKDNIDVDALAAHFASRDAAGAAFGPLSGRGNHEASVLGATISVDYGQPVKRGRQIFGNLVQWDKLWRTGANRATHFETDKTLQFDTVTVPPGTYTLFTIPQPTGGTLIINKQTGQGGTTYNEDQDLGRVAMTRVALETPVEVFTITTTANGQEGVLQLSWDQTAFTVPFSVKQ
ncbi:MAG: DUF2911 domain-containing protein [Bacteroidota bacterium]